MSGSGSPSVGPARWLASTDRPNASTRRWSRQTSCGCGRGCGTSQRLGLGGVGGVPPSRPAGKAGSSTTSASSGCGVTRASRSPTGCARSLTASVGTAVGAMGPIRPNALWGLDLQFDVTADGRTLELLNVVDEYTRECPAIVVDRHIDADRVGSLLEPKSSSRTGASTTAWRPDREASKTWLRLRPAVATATKDQDRAPTGAALGSARTDEFPLTHCLARSVPG